MTDSEQVTCPNCGEVDNFQEVGSVATVTPVVLEMQDGRPTFVDYSDTGSEPIWDASEGYYIECRHCLTRLAVAGYASKDEAG